MSNSGLTMTESHAIRSCLKYRDPQGFEFLVKKYRREAFMHALILLGNQEDAADACQESFTRAYMAMPKLQSLDAFYPWFYRILKNCCLNMISRAKTSKRYRQSNPAPEVAGPNPDVLLEKQEEQLRVWEVLHRLSLDHREILVLKYIKGCRYDEISHILDIPRGTVMSRLYLARKAFRQIYESSDNSHSSKEKVK